MIRAARLAACVCAALHSTGCTRESAPGGVTVYAAASMAPALDRIAAAFEAEHGATMAISYASSSALAQQIQNGAPADLFISADLVWAAALEAGGHAEARAEFLGNSLVLIAPAKDGTAVQRPEDLAGDAVKRIAIGDPRSVPAGRYAMEALEALGLADRIASKLAPALDVRQALLYVERGEAEAGIVYATDAKSSTAVRVVAALDEHLNSPVRYAIVLVKRAERSAAAEDAFAFLRSETGLQTFEAAGFLRPSPAAVPAPARN